ncbi:MAG: selenoprotein W-related protein [Rhodothermales bacterium]|jgi:selenoprotein W-related protein
MAQELLSTFAEEITDLTLQPGASGVFEVWAGEQRVWSRKDDAGFPEIADLKRRVRDVIAPERDLGCIDRKAAR